MSYRNVCAGGIRELAQMMDEKPEKMKVNISGKAEIDMDSSGRIIFRVAGHRPDRIDLRRRWIADHPLPLKTPCTLYLTPVDANRFRVRLFPEIKIPTWWWWICSILATIGIFYPFLLILSLVFTISAFAIGHYAQRKNIQTAK